VKCTCDSRKSWQPRFNTVHVHARTLPLLPSTDSCPTGHMKEGENEERGGGAERVNTTLITAINQCHGSLSLSCTLRNISHAQTRTIVYSLTRTKFTRMCTSKYTHTHTHARARTRARTHTCTHARTHTHTHTHIHSRTHTPTYTHIHLHTTHKYKHTHTHTHMCVCEHHTYTHCFPPVCPACV